MKDVNEIIREKFHEVPTRDYNAPVSEPLHAEQWAKITEVCEALAYLYDGDLYIGDMIVEAADAATPIDNKALIRAGEDVEAFVGEVIADGYNLDPKTFRLSRLIQAGYMCFLEAAAYENLQTLFFNRFAQAANADPRLTGEDPDDDPPVDLEELEAAIEEAAAKIDNNMTFAEADAVYREAVRGFKA
jgi:hypothetical protein